MLTKEEIFCIWIDSFDELTYVQKSELLKFAERHNFDELEKAFKANANELRRKFGDANFTKLISLSNKNYVKTLLDELDKFSLVPVTQYSKYYPDDFIHYGTPPIVLYAKGNLELLKSDCFGIVGSRRSIALSVRIAEDYSETLSKAGFTLVTGIAEGIDCTVLRKGLDTTGKVISVIAGGVDNIYPQSNANLAKEVSEKGLLISEQRPGVKSMPYMFPIRNRIIAGLSRGVLVVSGRKKSGTMYTANYALDYGKNVYAIPYSIGIESGEGCNEIIKTFASLTDSPNDILKDYKLKIVEKEKLVLTELERSIYNLLKNSEMHVEQISSALNKPTREILSAISLLEIKKIIVKSGVNSYSALRLDMEE